MVGFAAFSLKSFFFGWRLPGGERFLGEVGERCGDEELFIFIGLIPEDVKMGNSGEFWHFSCLIRGESSPWSVESWWKWSISPKLSLPGEPIACCGMYSQLLQDRRDCLSTSELDESEKVRP